MPDPYHTNFGGSHILVRYPSYNQMVWGSIEHKLHECHDKTLHAKLLIKGNLDKTRTDYEGAGVIKTGR